MVRNGGETVEDVTLTGKMADFVAWTQAQGKDTVTKMIREHLEMLKAEYANVPFNKDGFRWDDILTPNDGSDQWKQGGDCNYCRREPYCKKQCRANRELKKVATPFLYEQFLADNPEDMVKSAHDSLTPDKLLDQLGIEHEEIVQ